MKPRWRSEIPILLPVVAMFVAAALTWPGAPERIPVHYDLHGQVDRYGGRVEGLLVMPLVALGVYLLLLFLPRLDPGRANYASFRGTYDTLRLLIMWFLTVIYTVILAGLRGFHVPVHTVFPLAMGALLVVIGNLLGKVRPNWFVGIRTPWTLSSKESWVRTHRVGGRVFVAQGVIFSIAALVRTRWALPVAVGLMAVSILALAAYSYWVWRNDPEKISPAGTSPA